MNVSGPEQRPPSLQDLEERLKKGRQDAGLEPQAHSAADMSGAGVGLRAGVEFFVATCVGAGLGFGIGTLAGGKVIGLVVGLFIGFAAGIRGAIRLTAGDNEAPQKGDDANDGHVD